MTSESKHDPNCPCQRRKPRVVWPDDEQFERTKVTFKVLMFAAGVLGSSIVGWGVWISKQAMKVSVLRCQMVESTEVHDIKK